MYKCRKHPFTGKPKKVFAKGKEFLTQWYSDTGTSPPSVVVLGFAPPRPVLINWLKKHIDAKPIADKVTRYKILPCVRELLENTAEPPIEEADDKGEKTYVFYGLTAAGWQFKVAVKPDREGNLRLISCYRTR